MKINFKLRLKNKTTLVTLITLVVTLVYQALGLFGVVPTVAQSEIINTLGILINILVVLGVVVDPTTDGISDSSNALGYDEPKKEE
nr:MAG TPA: holin [Caudoviricetes sp.]DAP84012.1 MAG TPA: holin [Caudoviricetes sp.]